MTGKITDLPLRVMVILTAVATFAPFAIDAYLPALPDMARSLSDPGGAIQLTIGAFLLGLALGPMVFGPVSDAIGRRRAILIGVAGFAITSAGCAMAQSVDALIVLRFVQALLSGCAAVAAQALLADVYDGDRLAARTSMIMMALTVAPMIAPIVGEGIATNFGWRMIFWTMAVAALVLCLPALRILPETIPVAARGTLKIGPIARVYWGIFKTPVAVAYALVSGFGAAIFFTFVAASPFLYIETFGLSERMFAWVFGSGAVAALLFNLINVRVVARWGYRRVLGVQVALLLVVTLLTLAAANGLFGRWLIYATGICLMGFLQVTGANATAGLQAQFNERRGAAAAVYMFVRFSMGMAAVALVSWLGAVTPILYAEIIVGFAVACCLAAFAALHWTKEGRI